MERGTVSMRVAFVLRSAEVLPLFLWFVQVLIASNGVPVNSVPPKVISNPPTSPSWNLLCVPISDTQSTPKSSKRVVISHPLLLAHQAGYSLCEYCCLVCLSFASLHQIAQLVIQLLVLQCYQQLNFTWQSTKFGDIHDSSRNRQWWYMMMDSSGSEGNGGQRRRSWERVSSVASSNK